MNLLNNCNRTLSYLKRKLRILGLGNKIHQLIYFGSNDQNRILIVAAGNVSIPPAGWGAVERIIADSIPYLSLSYPNITIINSQRLTDWRAIKKMPFASIICHDDATLIRVARYFPKVPIIAVSHYGYLPIPSQWNKSYARVFGILNSLKY